MAPPAQLNPILPHTSQVPLLSNEEAISNFPCERRRAPVYLSSFHFHCSNCHPVLQWPFLHRLSWFSTSILTQKVFYTQVSHYQQAFSKLSEASCPSQETQTIHSLFALGPFRISRSTCCPCLQTLEIQSQILCRKSQSQQPGCSVLELLIGRYKMACSV